MTTTTIRRLGPSLLTCVLLIRWPSSLSAAPGFVRGDTNLDGQVSLADVMQIFETFGFGGAPLGCLDTLDFFDFGQVSQSGLNEAGALWLWLFHGSQQPAPPFPKAGPDPTNDNLGCGSTQISPPGSPVAGVKLAWEAPGYVQRGDQSVEAFLRVSTKGPIGSFSIAYRVDRKLFTNVRADFAETSFPKIQRAAFENSPYFQVKLVPLPNDPQYDLLLVGALFIDPQSKLVPQGVGTLSRIEFSATQGPVTDSRLLRVVFDIRTDAPVDGKETSAFVAADVSSLIPGDPGFHHGLRNELTPLGDLELISVTPGETGPWRTIAWDAGEFLRADANGDHCRDLSDAVSTLGFLFLGQAAPRCPDASDANDDGHIDISDSVFTLAYLFSGGPPPPSALIIDPDVCWFDDTADTLGSCVYECDRCPR